MSNTTYTTTDYLNAITREIQKRVTTYPKIIKKKEKQGVPEHEIMEILRLQQIQVTRLIMIEKCLQTPIESLDPITANEYFEEIKREQKMRKRYYPRLIYFKRITQQTADYETAVWNALTDFFKTKYVSENV